VLLGQTVLGVTSIGLELLTTLSEHQTIVLCLLLIGLEVCLVVAKLILEDLNVLFVLRLFFTQSMLQFFGELGQFFL
jgi:hypothetical protein